MKSDVLSLAAIELRLRSLLPADLYASVWGDPQSDRLMQVFEHLRTLQYILQDYVPPQVSENVLPLGTVRHVWQEGTLLFTDLAGFTTLMEANASYGEKGAAVLLNVLNHYFSEMIEIISKSGGDLLEFTGDAMLVQFLADRKHNHTAQAVRAGLRMQRAMSHFKNISAMGGSFSLGMRVGIHTGRFLTADIGTPMRMVHVLLGKTVQVAKRAEGAGRVGRVCLTPTAIAQLDGQFHCEAIGEDYALVQDNLSDEELGEYDITMARRRMSSPLLFDRSAPALIAEITKMVSRIEPLASYLPQPVLTLLVENAAKRQIPPNFPEATVMFVNLMGLPESVDQATSEEVEQLTLQFSRSFALINAAVKSRGGILQKVTYHLIGSDILIYFGVMNAHTDEAIRAAETALAIRQLVNEMPPVAIAGTPVTVTCRIGITHGSVFTAEIGEPRGRREFNVLGDPVNTASRFTSQATPNQILVSESLHKQIAHHFCCEDLGDVTLKGKAKRARTYALQHPWEDKEL